jgi:hypothetical protein
MTAVEVVAVTEPTEPTERDSAGQGMPSLTLVQLIDRIGTQPFFFYPIERVDRALDGSDLAEGERHTALCRGVAPSLRKISGGVTTRLRIAAHALHIIPIGLDPTWAVGRIDGVRQSHALSALIAVPTLCRRPRDPGDDHAI